MDDILLDSQNTLDMENQVYYRTIEYLKAEISLQTAIAVRDLREKESFENYGMDSVVIMDITKRLEEKLGHLSKTLFFESENIEELTGYLIQIKSEELKELFGLVKEEDTQENHNKKYSKNIGQYAIKNEIKKKNNSSAKKNLKYADRNMTLEKEDKIAIIGISGKYPMADNLAEYWENLKTGRDCITEIPENRWNHALYYTEDKTQSGKSYGRWGGFLKDVDKFDPLFFHMTPLEANFTDPQERMFLEESYHALEDAGYSRAAIDNTRTGVFVGVMFGLYQLIENKEYGSAVTGRNNFASIANRVSYFFNIHGPSISLDTMCSSSLTALHLACNSILNKEIDMAFVGGVNLSLHPNKYVQLSQGGFLSTDGRCRSFGADGDGYVPAEGVGSMLIKPLKKAEADGDHIYAVIKGIGVNAGGRTSGYTVPNPKAQSDLIKEVLKKSKINPETISYVEAHGTGTALGDPIEVNAITNVYREYGNGKQYCSIGSVKSNIGHAESAAGMASITKVILQMQNHQLVPSIHSDILNPYIDFGNTPFKVQHSLTEWMRPKSVKNTEETLSPRRAAISAFGAGGANAHLILEEYEPKVTQIDAENQKKPRLYLFSAKTRERLNLYVEAFLNFLNGSKETQGMEEENTSVQDQNRILTLIKESIASVSNLKVDNLYSSMSLYELGLGEYEISVIASKIQKECGQRITHDLLMAHPEIEELSRYLYEKENTKLPGKKRTQELSLDNLEYTLQVGREEMEDRLAVIADDRESLLNALILYLNGGEDGRYIRHGNTEECTDKYDRIVHSNMVEENKKKLLKDRNLELISELWVMGVYFDFAGYYVYHNRQRIALPTYPFEKLCCWVTTETAGTYLVDADSGKVSEGRENKREKTSKSVQQNVSEIRTLVQDENSQIKEEDLKGFTLKYLMEVFSNTLKIPKEKLSANTDFENFGLDSIYVKSINQHLEKVFGTLPSTLLFTYKNIKTLANYFVSNHKNMLKSLMTGIYAEKTEQKQENRQEALKEVRIENEPAEDAPYSDDIAIIGISGRMPQSKNLEDFFERLRKGEDFITEIPKERWDYEKYPEIKGHFGSFLTDVDKFDPQFFNISPMTAKFMDPQERVLIQSVWSCLEDAGYTPGCLENKDNEEDARGDVSVFIGTTFNEYGLYGAQEHVRGVNLPLNAQIYSMANRISYLLNLGGESLTVDTACSSSLYAVHLACESIRSGECGMSIAGGVNLSLHPSKYVTLNWGSFLAQDGHCRTFGEGGTGYVPGEGSAAVLLKPLKQAEADGDNIYGVIKGSAVNHGGKTYGYSVPNPAAQTAVIRKALRKAHVDPRTISYVEAHGTGTSLGDPIEISALTDAFQGYTLEKQYCAIGSVKSNIGHLEAAAGISQLFKVILQMKHKTLVPSRLNSDSMNKNLHFEDTPFYVQQKEEPWIRPVIGEGKEECKRRAGISAFGVGGVNVHMIVEEYDNGDRQESEAAGEVLIPISAKTEEILRQYIRNYIDWINRMNKKDIPKPIIEDVSYTLIKGRIQLAHRICFVTKDYVKLKQQMEQYLAHEITDSTFVGISYTPNENVIVEQEADLRKIASLWVSGEMSFDSLIQNPHTGRKTSLPTYPFAKETYWMYSREEDYETDSKAQINHEPMENLQEETVLEKLSKAYDSERLELIVDDIRHVFADLLGFTEGRLPDINEGYFSLGLESVETRQAYNILEERLHIELNDQVFFNYPSILKTSEYILSLLDIDHQEQTQDETMEPEDNALFVFVRKEYMRKDAEESEYEEAGAVLCICSKTYQQTLSNGFLSDQRNVHYVRDFKEGSVLLNSEWIPDRVLIFDIEIETNDIISLFKFIKILQIKVHEKVILQYYFMDNKEGDYKFTQQGAVRGFLSTLQMEDIRFICKEIRISSDFNERDVNDLLKEEYPADDYTNEVFYTGQGRYVQILRKMNVTSDESRFRKDGVYLITGGLGDIGIIISEYLCTRYQAKLILCGRKPEPDVLEKLEKIDTSGGSAIYLQADITMKDDVLKLADRIKKTYGHINGVIHAAGVSRDARIINKEEKEFAESVEPKVTGSLYLDEAFKEEKMDLFILCSSLSAMLGNIGQADYSFANSFLNEFARARNAKVKKNQRFGHTVSIDWPFWKNGGMKVDEVSRKWMKDKFGLLLMENKDGLLLLEIAAGTDANEFYAMFGYEEKIISSFLINTNTDCQPSTSVVKEDKAEEAIEAEVQEMSFDDIVAQLESELICE